MREKTKKRLKLTLKILCWTTAAAFVAGVVAFAVAWGMIDWTDEGTNDYPGGVVLRDSSGEVLRVSLGEGDVDCRPYYKADADDWIVKAIVASEDGCSGRTAGCVRSAFCARRCRTSSRAAAARGPLPSRCRRCG